MCGSFISMLIQHAKEIMEGFVILVSFLPTYFFWRNVGVGVEAPNVGCLANCLKEVTAINKVPQGSHW